jgi:hypothetical protein
MRWIQGSCLHRGFVFLFHRAISRLDIPRDDVSTTCVYLMRRFHHGPLRRRGKVSSWLISKVDYFYLFLAFAYFKAIRAAFPSE